VGVPDHGEQGVGFINPINFPTGIENFVPAML
jgi:hypothetical protein